MLKEFLNISVYEHFLLFHAAITILISSHHINRLGCKEAKNLLNIFVNHSEQIYGPQFCVYNVHLLCHLSTDVEIHGPLDTFSAFPFENYLGKLKKLVKKPNKPLQQICRRIAEINSFIYKEVDQNDISYHLEHDNGPLPVNFFHGRQYKKIHYKNTVFSIFTYSQCDAYC